MGYYNYPVGSQTIVLQLLLVDGYGPLTGESPTVAIRRVSDNYYFDFSTSTFKASGHLLLEAPLTDRGNGIYERFFDSSVAISDDTIVVAEYTNIGSNAFIDTDIITITTIEEFVDDIVPGLIGTGAYEFVYCVKDEITERPLEGADVWVSLDEEGTNIIAGSLKTGKDGCATFFLDPDCTYFIFRQRAGYNFDNPDVQTIGAFS